MRQKAKIETYDAPAGGWGSLSAVAHILTQEEVALLGSEILLKQNKAGGFMCVSCSWAKPAEPRMFEVCENGAKRGLLRRPYSHQPRIDRAGAKGRRTRHRHFDRGFDKTEKQVADCDNLIVQQVNVLLISPKESAGLTGVVEKAIDAKIPVIVLDRNVDTKRITQFIGGDNVAIGKAAGEHVVKLLGGPGKAAGNVVEIWGGMGTQPAHDRHDGFHAFTDKEPGIKYLLNNQSGDWKQDKAYDIMTTALRNNEKIDMVYGHNDPMAYGAYLAAKDANRDKDIKFIIGIDGLPDEGVTWVSKGQLAATFLYATPGAEGLRQAAKLLKGEKLEPVITLPTMLITKENASEILKKNG